MLYNNAQLKAIDNLFIEDMQFESDDYQPFNIDDFDPIEIDSFIK